MNIFIKSLLLASVFAQPPQLSFCMNGGGGEPLKKTGGRDLTSFSFPGRPSSDLKVVVSKKPTAEVRIEESKELPSPIQSSFDPKSSKKNPLSRPLTVFNFGGSSSTKPEAKESKTKTHVEKPKEVLISNRTSFDPEPSGGGIPSRTLTPFSFGGGASTVKGDPKKLKKSEETSPGLFSEPLYNSFFDNSSNNTNIKDDNDEDFFNLEALTVKDQENRNNLGNPSGNSDYRDLKSGLDALVNEQNGAILNLGGRLDRLEALFSERLDALVAAQNEAVLSQGTRLNSLGEMLVNGLNTLTNAQNGTVSAMQDSFSSLLTWTRNLSQQVGQLDALNNNNNSLNNNNNNETKKKNNNNINDNNNNDINDKNKIKSNETIDNNNIDNNNDKINDGTTPDNKNNNNVDNNNNNNNEIINNNNNDNTEVINDIIDNDKIKNNEENNKAEGNDDSTIVDDFEQDTE